MVGKEEPNTESQELPALGKEKHHRLDATWQAETRVRASVTGRGCEERDDDGPSAPTGFCFFHINIICLEYL